jgi:hypothetical protein
MHNSNNNATHSTLFTSLLAMSSSMIDLQRTFPTSPLVAVVDATTAASDLAATPKEAASIGTKRKSVSSASAEAAVDDEHERSRSGDEKRSKVKGKDHSKPLPSKEEIVMKIASDHVSVRVLRREDRPMCSM